MGAIQEYLAICLEILGLKVALPEEEKQAAYSNLVKIINVSSFILWLRYNIDSYTIL